jgi:hypothetical protein
MGVYYKCLSGDSQHLALMERDAVAIRDSRGRDWICYPIAPRKVENLTMAAHVSEVLEADATARRQGLGQEGTEVRIYYCDDERELFEKLLLDTAPENEKE